MQYGVIVYSDTMNLGDDIQSYANESFLPHTDYILEREGLDGFYTRDGKEVAVIMGGWYLYKHLNWPPSPFVRPLATSMHFDTYYSWTAGERITKNFLFEDYGGEWMRRYAPIGCRDYATKKLLERYNIPSYFSGCMTLTLTPFSKVEQHGKICLVDVSDDIASYVHSHATAKCVVMTHTLETKPITWEERKKIVEEQLLYYQGALLVITTRLHAALPCLALGTPVLFIKEDWALNRTETWLKYLHYTTEEMLLSGAYTYDFNHPLKNKSLHWKLSLNLTRQCENFIQACELTKETRHDVDMFLEERKQIERVQKLMLMRVDKYERILKGELLTGYESECRNSNIQSGKLST